MLARRAAALLLLLAGACATVPATPPVEDPGARVAAERVQGCKPLFALDRDEAPPHSCWHRAWEVPAAAVVYPVALVGALALILSPIWVPIALAVR